MRHCESLDDPGEPRDHRSRLAPSPVGSAGQIRVTKPSAAVRQTVVGSRAAPSRMARCGAPLATCRRPPISAASATRLPCRPTVIDTTALPRSKAPIRRSAACASLPWPSSTRSARWRSSTLVRSWLSSRPTPRPAGEAVGRMAQMVQGKARLVQRPLGEQRREDGRCHPQDGAAPGRQGAVQMLEPVQRQIGPPAAGRVAAQVSQLVEPKHGQMPRGDPVGRLRQRRRREHGLDLARKPPPRSPSSRALALANAAQCALAHPRRARPTAAASPARAGRHPRATAGGRRRADRATAANSSPAVPDATFRPFNLPPPIPRSWPGPLASID